MPNGGSDNCALCGFNRYNNWTWKVKENDRPSRDAYCEVRGIPIDNPFYTYCLNWHTQMLEPDGPVFSAIGGYARVPWHEDSIPQELGSGHCEECGEEFEKQEALAEGIVVAVPGGESLEFCTVEHYLAWWRKIHGVKKLPYYDYMPHSRTRDQVAEEWKKIGVGVKSRWWEFWWWFR